MTRRNPEPTARPQTSKPKIKAQADIDVTAKKADPAAQNSDTKKGKPSQQSRSTQGRSNAAVTDESGAVAKVIQLGGPIDAALTEAISEVVSHPTGDVEARDFWPFWTEGIVHKVSGKLGVQPAFVRAGFHKTDALGAPLEIGAVRVHLSVGNETRDALLIDPTPED